MAVIGIDVGTTQVKCGVFNRDGQLLKSYFAEYSIIRHGGYAYADIASMWENAKKVLSAAAKDNVIEGICVTSFGESFVPVTRDFHALGDSMLYTDPRGAEQANRLAHSITDAELYKTTGNIAHSMYALPKMMWLKENQAEIYNKADYLLPIGSFLQYMLCGETACDYSLCARTMALDIRVKRWSNLILDTAGIEVAKLPAAVKSGQIIGKIRKEIALELGLNKSCAVITGGHDQVCSALGAGVIKSGSSVDGIGTVECITPVFNEPISSLDMAEGGYSCIPYVTDGNYVTYLFNYTGGAMLKWFRDKLMPDNAAQLKQRGMPFYDYYDMAISSEPSDLMMLPHFAGAATPYMDINAKGAFINMSLETTPVDMYRAILECCTFEMRLNAEKVQPFGVRIDELTATGGGSKSKAWLKIKADIMGVPIYALKNEDAGITGAAMLALTALGYCKDLEQAAQMAVVKERPIYPNEEFSKVYEEKYQKYKKLYSLLKEVRI